MVGKSKAERLENEEKSKRENGHEDQTSYEIGHPKINKTYALISAGGATLALIGIAAGKTMLMAIGSAALVVGGVLLFTSKND